MSPTVDPHSSHHLNILPTEPENPQVGDAWVDTSTGEVRTFDGTRWLLIASGGPVQNIMISGDDISSYASNHTHMNSAIRGYNPTHLKPLDEAEKNYLRDSLGLPDDVDL